MQGLAPSVTDGAANGGPSHDQRALAAALARAVDAKDSGTRSHSETVAQLCVAIGERLGVAPAKLERLRMAGLLHDVGKIGVADSILQKPDALLPDERKAMDEHVNIGHAILISAELPIEAGWVLHHHERYDGKGYPERLARRRDPDRSEDHRRRRRVRGDDRHAALPRGDERRRGDRRAPASSRHASSTHVACRR